MFIFMNSIPSVGLGTYQVTKDERGIEAVRYAIEEAGYRHIDCAYLYMNESTIGKALHGVLSRGVVKREDLWITSKLWVTDYDPKKVESACRRSLRDLQLDYLDLYLIHEPSDANSIIKTWKAMEKLVSLGLCKHIGVSNFEIDLMEKLRVAPGVTMQPYANQVELHLYLQQLDLIKYCQNRNIFITGFSCLGAPGYISPKCPALLKDEVLNAIAKDIKRTPAQVELRFLLELGPNVSVLAKSMTPERIRSNLQLDFDLSQEQIDRLKARGIHFRYSDEW